ncbi:hypothetical protein P280DRAFT_471685 [Massarina eburnea CBS 473.64]|uniref:DNA polymerase epsilon subunit D n=1 Tax=Massarina eburnea CBS 473.64 TaxID=1395130 RepID=A0A6A6RRF4_9PLEO|nr:hypothetical protein P280DRAFT_471685 [Massarina eburnea CBS 473.64]
MSKSATVFVNYLTSCAAEFAARSNKKTVMPNDVFDAMHELEFEFMLPRLQAEVNKFTSIQADKRNTYRKKVREEKKAVKDKETTNGHGPGDDDTPPTKRARMEDGAEEESGVDDTVEVGEDQDVDEEVEDDEVDEDEEGDGAEGLTEDPLEEREEAEDDEMEDGDESD